VALCATVLPAAVALLVEQKVVGWTGTTTAAGLGPVGIVGAGEALRTAVAGGLYQQQTQQQKHY